MISTDSSSSTSTRATPPHHHAIGARRPWISMLLAATAFVAHERPARAGTFAQGPNLRGTGAVGAAQQGESVALSSDGNTAIVGGFTDNTNAGAVWVFTRSGGVWTQQGAKLVGGGAVGSAIQGASVALSSDGNTRSEGRRAGKENSSRWWAYH